MENLMGRMSRQRYDQVPQHDTDPIILSSITNPAYAYNTANVLPPSTSRSSISSQHPPSIPNSPPPSFHTHSSPGTPRPTPSTTAPSIAPAQSHRSFGAASLWGVALSTTTGDEGEATSNDALATIAGLKQRVEWLEESIGRLLIEREQNQSKPSIYTSENQKDKPHRDNCCVTFTDASPDLEAALLDACGSNCCVSYRGNHARGDGKREARRQKMICGLVGLFIICVCIVLVVAAGPVVPMGPPRPRGGEGTQGEMSRDGGDE